jgi:hypothetical protein
MKKTAASLAIVATVAAAGIPTIDARAAGLSRPIVSDIWPAPDIEADAEYLTVDYNTYFYTHKPGSTPPTINGNNPNGDQTRSNRPNEQPPTTCTNVRVDNRSGPPTWKQVCRTGYF